jgi:hypothetical protein
MTTKDKVRQLLRDNPKLRDSDKALLGAYWESEGLILTPEQKRKFMDVTVAETITRDRRELRSEYPGSDEVEKERFKKYEEYTNEYGQRAMRII